MQVRNAIGVLALLAVIAANARAQTLQIVDDLPGKFIDISKTGGTPLHLGDDEEVEIGTLPGNFVFLTGTVVVGNNGGMGFGSLPNNDLAAVNQAIPSDDAFGGGQAALPFWDDIDDKEGDVYFLLGEDRVIVQWNDRNLAGTGDTVDFQVQVFYGAGPEDIIAQYLFADIEQPGAGGGVSASIGYQDGGAGFGDFQWSFDTADAVGNGTVLSLILVHNTHAVPAASHWSLGVLLFAVVTAGIFGIRRQRRGRPLSD